MSFPSLGTLLLELEKDQGVEKRSRKGEFLGAISFLENLNLVLYVWLKKYE